MLDAGTYRARAVQAALGEAGTGTEQVAVLFELLDVPGKQLTWYGYWTEATWERTVDSLRIAGWTGSDISDLSELSSPAAPEVFIVVTHDPDQNGVMRERVRWVNRTNGLQLKKTMDPGKAKAFATRVRAQILLYDKQQGGTREQGAGQEPPPMQDSDLPF